VERTKCAVRTGGLAIAISLGMALAPGVAFAEPDGAGSSASSDSSSAPGGGGGATDNSDPQQGAVGASGPDSTLNSQSTQDTSSEIKSRMAASLAKIDNDETQVEKRRGVIDQDLKAPSRTVELVDREADLLKRQQELAHQVAVQQATSGIVQGVGSIGYELQDLQNQSGLTLDELSAVLDAQRAQSLEAAGTAVQQDAATLQAVADMMRLTSAEIESFLADIAAAQQGYLNAAAGNRG
jgi:hypothetical protein